ncbi:MAG: ATP-binding protein [Archangium sp.]
MLQAPPHLHVFRQLRIAEELHASARHAVRNKLAAVRNAGFYVRRKLDRTSLPAEDPKLGGFLQLIDSELNEASLLLMATKITPPVTSDMGDAARAVLSGVTLPPNVTLSVHGDDRCEVFASRPELELAFYEVLANAVDAAGDQPSRLRVVWDSPSKLESRLVVEDDGPGVREIVARLFSPGFSTREHRLGLGLKLARRLITTQRGTLTVEPAGQRGTRATIVLPKGEA